MSNEGIEVTGDMVIAGWAARAVPGSGVIDIYRAMAAKAPKTREELRAGSTARLAGAWVASPASYDPGQVGDPTRAPTQPEAFAQKARHDAERAGHDFAVELAKHERIVAVDLRDRMAREAPITFEQACKLEHIHPDNLINSEVRAKVFNTLGKVRYEYADAMLAARGRKA